jgi:hypothetical protein
VSELAPTPPTTEAPRAGMSRRHLRWPGGLPKTVLATAVLTLLSAWFFPALSHQWQDRQKAREMTATIVSEIGKNTSQALVTSSFVNFNRFRSSADPSRTGFNQDVFNRLDRDWRTSSAEIEAQLQAYFPNSVVRAWRDYSNLVWGTYRLPTDNVSARPATVRELRRRLAGRLPPRHFVLMQKAWLNEETPRAREARNAYFYVSRAVLNERSAVIDEILASHPAGFSTRPNDVLSDLLPFF